MTMKLYHVSTIVREYRRHKNVLFEWFYESYGTRDLPFAELLVDYDPSDDEFNVYRRSAVDELFTEQQAEALKAYIDSWYCGTVTTICEAALPVERGRCGCSVLPVGGLTGFLDLYDDPAYTLPFRVAAHYDLRPCELAEQEDG
jgi:hypothetical protein